MFRLYTQTHIYVYRGGKDIFWIFCFLQNLGLTPAAFLWGRNGSTQYKQVGTPRWWGLQFSVCWRICVTRSGSAINRKSLFPQGSSLTRSFWDSLRLRGIFVFSLWKFLFSSFSFQRVTREKSTKKTSLRAQTMYRLTHTAQRRGGGELRWFFSFERSLTRNCSKAEFELEKMKKDFSNRVEMELGGAPAIFRSPPQCHMRVNNSRWSTEAPLSHKKKRRKRRRRISRERGDDESFGEWRKQKGKKKRKQKLYSLECTQRKLRVCIYIYTRHISISPLCMLFLGARDMRERCNIHNRSFFFVSVVLFVV